MPKQVQLVREFTNQRKQISRELSKADTHLDKAFNIISQLAFTDDSPLNDAQRIIAERAIKQITNASANLHKIKG